MSETRNKKSLLSFIKIKEKIEVSHSLEKMPDLNIFFHPDAETWINTSWHLALHAIQQNHFGLLYIILGPGIFYARVTCVQMIINDIPLKIKQAIEELDVALKKANAPIEVESITKKSNENFENFLSYLGSQIKQCNWQPYPMINSLFLNPLLQGYMQKTRAKCKFYQEKIQEIELKEINKNIDTSFSYWEKYIEKCKYDFLEKEQKAEEEYQQFVSRMQIDQNKQEKKAIDGFANNGSLSGIGKIPQDLIWKSENKASAGPKTLLFYVEEKHKKIYHNPKSTNTDKSHINSIRLLLIKHGATYLSQKKREVCDEKHWREELGIVQTLLLSILTYSKFSCAVKNFLYFYANEQKEKSSGFFSNIDWIMPAHRLAYVRKLVDCLCQQFYSMQDHELKEYVSTIVKSWRTEVTFIAIRGAIDQYYLKGDFLFEGLNTIFEKYLVSSVASKSVDSIEVKKNISHTFMAPPILPLSSHVSSLSPFYNPFVLTAYRKTDY